MITLGSKDTVVLDDDWTVVTADRSLVRPLRAHLHAHPRGAWVLTALDGGEEIGARREARSPLRGS